MRIDPIKNMDVGRRSERRRPAHVDQTSFSANETGSLVVVQQAKKAYDERSQPTARRAFVSAPLVAHLIATHEQLPQTRTLRRVSTSEGNGAYAQVRQVVKASPQAGSLAISA